MEVTNQLDGKPSQETLLSWLAGLNKTGLKALPSMAKTLVIQLAIVFAFQLVFWWQGISHFIPSVIKKPVIFLTATYNDVIPKALFWIIVFTFGKRLLFLIKKVGFKKAVRPILKIVPEFKKTFKALPEKAYSLLLLGGGIGLIIANNFASYSRFSGARNRFDKYFIALVISFTVSYLLAEGRKHWMFTFARLTASDLSRVFKINMDYTDNHTFLLLSGFVLGLLLDAPLIFLRMAYGGYILGLVSILGGIVLAFLSKKKVVLK